MRVVVGHRDCADHNNDNEYRPCNRHDNDPANDHQFRREYRHLQPGLGLLHVPNDGGYFARTLLLHQGHNRGRSSRPRPEFIGDPTGHAGYRLLLDSG